MQKGKNVEGKKGRREERQKGKKEEGKNVEVKKNILLSYHELKFISIDIKN